MRYLSTLALALGIWAFSQEGESLIIARVFANGSVTPFMASQDSSWQRVMSNQGNFEAWALPEDWFTTCENSLCDTMQVFGPGSQAEKDRRESIDARRDSTTDFDIDQLADFGSRIPIVGMATNIPIEVSGPLPLEQELLPQLEDQIQGHFDSLAAAWLVRRENEPRPRAAEALTDFEVTKLQLPTNGEYVAHFLATRVLYGSNDCGGLYGVVSGWAQIVEHEVEVLRASGKWENCDFMSVSHLQFHGAFTWQGIDYIMATEDGWEFEETWLWAISNDSLKTIWPRNR